MTKPCEQPISGCSPLRKKEHIVRDDLIRAALAQYGLEHAAWTLIRHNENLTVNVEDRYLLRVHLHADGFSTDALYEELDRAAIRRAELAFLSHLAKSGLPVQKPVPNLRGSFLTMLPSGICATLLRWLPGHTPGEEDVAHGIYFRTGAMTARMHRAAVGFKAEGLLRYDASLCRRLQDWLLRANRDDLLSKDHTEVLQAACRVMESRLDGDGYIAVHADLCSSNILVTDSGLAPIDFSLMGLGHPMLDIGSLFCSVNGIECRKLIAEGYRSEGGVISFPELDACFAINILLYIALHLNAGNRMTDNLDRWRRHTFGPLAEGKRLIGVDFRMLNVPD